MSTKSKKQDSTRNQTQDEVLTSLAKEINTIASSIANGLIDVASRQRAVCFDAYQCGKLLIQVKDIVSHGSFKKWIEDNCQGLKYSTARRYMLFAGRFHNVKSVEDLAAFGIENLQEAYQICGIINPTQRQNERIDNQVAKVIREELGEKEPERIKLPLAKRVAKVVKVLLHWLPDPMENANLGNPTTVEVLDALQPIFDYLNKYEERKEKFCAAFRIPYKRDLVKRFGLVWTEAVNSDVEVNVGTGEEERKPTTGSAEVTAEEKQPSTPEEDKMKKFAEFFEKQTETSVTE